VAIVCKVGRAVLCPPGHVQPQRRNKARQMKGRLRRAVDFAPYIKVE
jgi:hypothetical protein